MTAVYLSANRILAVSGKTGRSGAVIQQCCFGTELAPFMFNGNISDEAGFCAALREFFRKNNLPTKGVKLVLDSPQIILRRMKIPRLNRLRLLSFIRNDFSDLERNRHPVYAYVKLARKRERGLQSLLAIQTDSDYVHDLVNAFRKCGITVVGVQAAISCGIRALKDTRNAGRTYILQVLEENGVSSLLFVHGEYTYSSYTRLTARRGTPEFGQETARAVNVITQFAQAQHVSETVTDVLFAGFSEQDRAAATEAIGNLNAGIRTDKLGESSHIRFADRSLSLQSCLFAAGGMLPAERSSELPARQEQSAEATKKHRSILTAAILLSALRLTLLAASIFVLKAQADRQAQLAQIKAYNQDEQVLEQVAAHEEQLAQAGELKRRNTAAEAFAEALQSYPLPNQLMRTELNKSAAGLTEVTILSYDSTTGELKLDTLASEVEKISRFIDAVNSKDCFRVTEYSGYVYDETEKAWRVSVTVTLAAEAGRRP